MNLMWPMLLLMLLNESDRLSTLERLARMPVVQEDWLEGESGGVELDERGFGRCLEDLDTRFRKRATDKKLVQLPLLGAAGADNELVVDVWALALAQLARHRGMAAGFSSDVIPVDALS